MSSTADRFRVGSLALALAALLFTGCSSQTPDPTTTPGVNTNQACTEPQASASVSIVARSESITIEGTGWQECHDTPNNTTPSAWGDISLEWVQGGVTTYLGDVTPVNGAFRFIATTPSEARPGPATIRITAVEVSAEIPVTVEGS